MTQKPSEFIGRKNELRLIEQFFQQENKLEVVCINGPGGIGKTRMLQEIHSRFKQINNLFISDIFDFDDPSFHILRNFRLVFAEQLESSAMRPYLNALADFRKMELANMSPERLTEESEKTDKIFVSCYNNSLASRNRMILLFDTLEMIQNEYLWKNYLLNQLAGLKNTLIILAGRKLDQIKPALEENFGKENCHFISLAGFSLDEANAYFDWSRVGQEIEPTLREKINFLADGKPILIDLAIDWLRWDIPLPDLLEQSLEDLEKLEPDKLKDLRERFEQALVVEVLGFNRPTDRAILDMACVHRFFNEEMIEFLLGLSPVKAKEIMRSLGQFTFVKSRPQANFMLHDEMRRMVNNYAWPKYDPFGTQKKKTQAKIAKFYKLKTEALETQLNAKIARLAKIHSTGDLVQEIRLNHEIAALEREFWLQKIEELYHSLRYDLKKALKIFIESADKATEDFRYEYRRVIFDEILLFEKNFKPQDQYEIHIRLAKYSLDKGQYEKAFQELSRLLHEFADGGHREIDMLIQLGNATIRMGRSGDTLDHLKRALNLSKRKKLKNWYGIIYNELGWTNRQLGNWDEAIKNYEKALEHSQKVNDRMSLADTLNNLGFAYSLKGDFSSALAYCHQSLELRTNMGLNREIGMSHNTLSMIYRVQEKFEISLQHSNMALAIFRAQNDIEWLGKVYRERGVTRWQTGQLEMARSDLEQSLATFEEYDYKNELPTTYYRLGHILWDLGLSEQKQSLSRARCYFERAEVLFQQSYEVGMDIADLYSAINSLAALIELLYDMTTVAAVDRVSDLKQYYKKLQKIDNKSAFHYPLYLGSAERILGAVEQDAGHISRSLAHYKKAYPLIARHGGYQRLLFDQKAIKFLGRKITELDHSKAVKWCDELIKHWQAEGLASDYPEFINYCKIWRMRASMKNAKVNA